METTTLGLQVLSPVAETRPGQLVPAPRLQRLDGKKIGLWWNLKFKGDLALDTVARELEKRFDGLSFQQFAYLYPCEIYSPGAYEAVRNSGVDAIIGTTAD